MDKNEEYTITLGKSTKLIKIKCDKNGNIIKNNDADINVDENTNVNKNNGGHILVYDDNAIDVITGIDNNKWFCAMNMCKIMEYKYTAQAIRKNVSKENKITLEELGIVLKTTSVINPKKKSMIYINRDGVFELLLKSKMQKAQEFRKWLTSHVLPEIDDTGEYHKYKSKIPSSFYDDNFLYKYDKKRVVYLGFCCLFDGKIIYKYGITSDIYKREYGELQSDIIGFKIIYIRECSDNDIIEASLEKELMLRNLRLSMKFNGKNFTELFTVTEDFDIEKVKNLTDAMIDNNIANDERNNTDRYNYLAELEKTKRLDMLLKFLENSERNGNKVDNAIYSDIIKKNM